MARPLDDRTRRAGLVAVVFVAVVALAVPLVRSVTSTAHAIRPSRVRETREQVARFDCIDDRIKQAVPGGAPVFIDTSTLVRQFMVPRLLEHNDLADSPASPAWVVTVDVDPFGPCESSTVEVRSP